MIDCTVNIPFINVQGLQAVWTSHAIYDFVESIEPGTGRDDRPRCNKPHLGCNKMIDYQ